jgi:hypothetical protein
MSETIEVIVRPDGSSRIETHGFAGNSCRAASEFLESALGLIAAEHLTAEYYQHVTPPAAIRQNQTPG